jgi:hypothetical protein
VSGRPYRHCRGIWRDGLQMGVELNKTFFSHTLADREHLRRVRTKAELQLPKVRRPRGRASANAARADVISARVFAQKRCNKQLH